MNNLRNAGEDHGDRTIARAEEAWDMLHALWVGMDVVSVAYEENTNAMAELEHVNGSADYGPL